MGLGPSRILGSRAANQGELVAKMDLVSSPWEASNLVVAGATQAGG